MLLFWCFSQFLTNSSVTPISFTYVTLFVYNLVRFSASCRFICFTYPRPSQEPQSCYVSKLCCCLILLNILFSLDLFFAPETVDYMERIFCLFSFCKSSFLTNDRQSLVQLFSNLLLTPIHLTKCNVVSPSTIIVVIFSLRHHQPAPPPVLTATSL